MKSNSVKPIQATLVYLLKQNQILLGYKKTGVGQGNYVGIGGKIEKDETPLQAAVREVKEEICVNVISPVLVGEADFVFPDMSSLNHYVFVYIATEWFGQIKETDVIKPKWFKQSTLPLDHMWDDAQFWLPAVLSGHKLFGKFIFGMDKKVKKLSLKEM